MKTSTQVRRHGSAVPSPKQAPKHSAPRTRAARAGDGSPEPVTTLQFQGPDGAELARVDLPDALVPGLRKAAQAAGVSVGEYARQAVQEKLSFAMLNADGAYINRPHEELEAAINQAQALNELLEHRVLKPDGGGEYCDEIQCGLVELGAETFRRLRSAGELCAAGKERVR